MRGAAFGAHPAFTSYWQVEHAQHWLTLAQQGDQRAEDRDTSDKGRRSIDGVEHPDQVGIRLYRIFFFAQDAVGREGVRNSLAQRALNLRVNLGYETAVCLDLRVRPLLRLDGRGHDTGAFCCESEREIQPLLFNHDALQMRWWGIGSDMQETRHVVSGFTCYLNSKSSQLGQQVMPWAPIIPP